MGRLEKGEHFGSYVIEGFIASGGMGDVYAATHAVYGTPVAIKVLHAQLHADQGWRKRFNEEGVVGQQLKHPHVLSTRELVEYHDRIGLVMELVRGAQTLSKLVYREFPRGLPASEALILFLGILQGVEYVHSKGVVHGDIKPENVLVEGDPRDVTTWVPKVTDYGTYGIMAHPVYIDGMPAVVASPRYASPEHLRGVDRLEDRSDIYSLGLLLHFLLTGQHASSAKTVEQAALAVVRPPSVSLLVDQPEALVRAYQQATSFELGERFPDCRAFALAIREVLDALGVSIEVGDLDADLATEVMEERQRRLRGEVPDPSATGLDEPTRPVDTNAGDTVPISREHTRPATDGWDEQPVPEEEGEPNEPSMSLPEPELPEQQSPEPELSGAADAAEEAAPAAVADPPSPVEPEAPHQPPAPIPEPDEAGVGGSGATLAVGLLVALAVGFMVAFLTFSA